MGETSTNIATLNMNDALKVRVKDGCDVEDPCASSSCPPHSHCWDTWDSYSCICDRGGAFISDTIIKEALVATAHLGKLILGVCCPGPISETVGALGCFIRSLLHMVSHPYNLPIVPTSTWQENCCMVEASLGCIVSFGLAWAMEVSLLSASLLPSENLSIANRLTVSMFPKPHCHWSSPLVTWGALIIWGVS